jgi:hypothetical protein
MTLLHYGDNRARKGIYWVYFLFIFIGKPGYGGRDQDNAAISVETVGFNEFPRIGSGEAERR